MRFKWTYFAVAAVFVGNSVAMAVYRLLVFAFFSHTAVQFIAWRIFFHGNGVLYKIRIRRKKTLKTFKKKLESFIGCVFVSDDKTYIRYQFCKYYNLFSMIHHFSLLIVYNGIHNITEDYIIAQTIVFSGEHIRLWIQLQWMPSYSSKPIQLSIIS